jgi:SpoVK/Ycf46/Vps4 family AAA+-type ATPase
MATISDAKSPRSQMHSVDRLLMLFRAFRERNEEAFERVAEAIIADEAAANHHHFARELQRALSSDPQEKRGGRRPQALTALPRDRRHGEQLITVSEPSIDATRLVLLSETRQYIERIVDEIRGRQKLARHGLRPKSKLLFWGSPGCGKTLTAHWLALEIGLPVGLVRLNALITSYLGETAAHIQRVFDVAQSTPMVLLLDEADAIGKDRDDPHDVGELKRVINSLLQAMDTFRSGESILIAASNHQHLLDPALWRRFDDVIEFPKPNLTEIQQFVERLLNGVAVSGSLRQLYQNMKSLAFADIERCIMEAVKTMVLQDRRELKASDLEAEVKRFKQLNKRARNKPRPTP